MSNNHQVSQKFHFLAIKCKLLTLSNGGSCICIFVVTSNGVFKQIYGFKWLLVYKWMQKRQKYLGHLDDDRLSTLSFLRRWISLLNIHWDKLRANPCIWLVEESKIPHWIPQINIFIGCVFFQTFVQRLKKSKFQRWT